MALPRLSRVLAQLITVAACQPAPPSAGPPPAQAAAVVSTDPAAAPDFPLTGNLGLRIAGSLGVGGRQIAFITDDRWVSSAGYQVTLWEGAVPKSTFHLDSYNYLAVSTDERRVYGDHEVVDLASAIKTPALASSPAPLGAQPPRGREIEHLRMTPDGAIALLQMQWRPPRGIPETGPDGERSYRHVYPNTPPEDLKFWYLVDGTSGATLAKLPAGNSPFSAFSRSMIAVGGTPNQGDVTVVPRPALAKLVTVSMGPTYVNQVDISPDERWLLAADNTGQVAVWDASALASAPITWAAHDKPTGGIAFHPHAPLLVTTSLDKTLKLWRLGANAPQLVATLTLAAEPLAVAFAPSGRKLHVGVERHDAVTESIAIIELTP